MERMSLIYIVSPRSASSDKPGRKISSIIEHWREKYSVDTFYGADILTGSTVQGFGNEETHNKFYRRYRILEPLVNTYSELKDILHNFSSYNFLKKFTRKKNYKLVWERSSRLHFAGLLIARNKSIPYILEWKDHLIDYKYSLLKPLALFIEDYKCRSADKIIVESNVLKEYLADKGYERSKIIVAHNAVDTNIFSRQLYDNAVLKKNLNVPTDAVLVGYLGSYAFYHDATLLVLASKLLNERGYKGKYKVLMIGNGKDFQKCKHLAEKLYLMEQSIYMRAAVPPEEVPAFLSVIDVSVLPGSTSIISPIKILEYMGSSTAVVAPDHKCNREIITDLNDGLLFEPGSEIDLANKIESLINSPDLIDKLSTNGYETVLQKYSWENTWGKALEACMEIDFK